MIPKIYLHRLNNLKKNYENSLYAHDSKQNNLMFYKNKIEILYERLEKLKSVDIDTTVKAERVINCIKELEIYTEKCEEILKEFINIKEKYNNEILMMKSLIKQSVPNIKEKDLNKSLEEYIIQ